MTIDAVAVPDLNSSDQEEDQDDFDIELVFQKALLEADSEWKQSAQKKVIDTKAKRGDLQRCLPSKGRFSFVHIDFDGMGGCAHIVEDTLKFGRLRMLETLAGGPLGNVVVNLKQPLRRDECLKHAKELKSLFSEYCQKEQTHQT